MMAKGITNIIRNTVVKYAFFRLLGHPLKLLVHSSHTVGSARELFVRVFRVISNMKKQGIEGIKEVIQAVLISLKYKFLFSYRQYLDSI